MIHPTVRIPENGRLSPSSRDAAREAIKDATRDFLACGGRIQRLDIMPRTDRAYATPDMQRCRKRGIANSPVSKPQAGTPVWYAESIANLKAKECRP